MTLDATQLAFIRASIAGAMIGILISDADVVWTVNSGGNDGGGPLTACEDLAHTLTLLGADEEVVDAFFALERSDDAGLKAWLRVVAAA